MCVRSHISGTSWRTARSTGCWPTSQSVASVQSLRTVQPAVAAAVPSPTTQQPPAAVPTAFSVSTTNSTTTTTSPHTPRSRPVASTAGSVSSSSLSLWSLLLFACAATVTLLPVVGVTASGDQRLADYRGGSSISSISSSGIGVGGCRTIGSNQLDSVITFFVLNMAYSWENRVDFVVKYMYDIDNNGQLDQKDFECMAVRACVIEGRGECNPAKLAEYQHIMRSLWEEISQLADFDKDGRISTDEFKQAVKNTCMGKKYSEFPQAMKAFIETTFRMIDVDGDGVVGQTEFVLNCISRIAVDDVKLIQEAYQKLLNDDDKRRGGITLSRYQELYALYLGNPDEKNAGVYLFGPLNAGD